MKRQPFATFWDLVCQWLTDDGWVLTAQGPAVFWHHPNYTSGSGPAGA